MMQVDAPAVWVVIRIYVTERVLCTIDRKSRERVYWYKERLSSDIFRARLIGLDHIACYLATRGRFLLTAGQTPQATAHAQSTPI